MGIPLENFVDRSNLQVPLGLLTSTGLKSAMRNPMYSGFGGQIILDFRPRDNIQYSGYSDEKRRVTFSTFGGGGAPTLVAEKGFKLSTDPTGATSFLYTIDRVNSQADTASTPYNSDTSTVVMLAAIQITGYRGANLADPMIGYARLNNADYNTAATGFGTGDNVPMYARVPNEAGATSQIIRRRYQRDDLGFEDDFVDSATATVDTATSWNKWILVQICKQPGSPETFNMRMLGGQWGDAGVPDSQTLTDDGTAVTWATYDLMLPVSSTVVLGFATVAQYTGNNDAGVNGTGVGHITWTLFDQDHICKELTITGNRISWTCTGEVAWQIKIAGTWRNTDGGAGYNYKGTQDVESSHVVDTEEFTAIRPILRNYGTMYADSNSTLSLVSVSTIAAAASPSNPTNVRTYTSISFANIANARYTEITSPHTSGIVTYEFRKKHIPSETFSIRSDINISKYPQIKSISASSISIELPERTSYQIRFKKTNSEWSAWTDFTTRKIDFDHPAQKTKETVTKTSRGARVVNTDTGFSTVRSIKYTSRGAIIDNTKTDYNS